MDIITAIVPTLHGWCTVEKAEKIYRLIIDNNLKSGVELGVFGGRSLFPMALACKETGGHVTGIDPWNKEACLEGDNSPENAKWWSNIDYNYMYTYTCNLFKDNYLEEIVSLRRVKSEEAVLFFTNESLDFIHQDSNHSEKISCDEVERWLPKLKVGGYWIADDTNWETTRVAQQYLTTNGCEEIYDSGSWKIYKKIT